MYHSGVMDLEELLYHIEKMVLNFTFSQAQFLISIFSKLIDKYIPKLHILTITELEKTKMKN